MLARQQSFRCECGIRAKGKPLPSQHPNICVFPASLQNNMALEFDVWNQWCSEESMLDWTVPYKWMVYVMHDMYVKQLYTPYAVGWSKSEINSTYVYCSWDITLISVSELPSMYCLQMLSLVSTELWSSYLHQHFVKDLQVVYIHRIYHCKSICYFDNCNCYQNCNCGLEIVPCGSQLW